MGDKKIGDAIDGAREAPPPKPKGKAATPRELALALMRDVDFITDDTDTVFRHNGRYWEELSDATLRQIAMEFDWGKTTKSRRNEIIDIVKGRSHRRGMKWGRTADYEVPFENGVLDVRDGKIRPHDPEDLLDRVIPHAIAMSAGCPVWHATLEQWFSGQDDEHGGPIAALQEFFGYVLLPHARFKKALLVYGPGDTGKSIIAFVLGHIVGHDRVGSLPLEKMDDLQARAAIVGKALNVVTEVTSQALIADGGFKAMISTEEPLLINEKYKPPFSYWPTAKHVFVTNNLPGMTDRTEAVLNRLLIIPMDRIFTKEEQDDELQAKLVAELPGILAWSVEGAKRLCEQRGKFSEVAGGADVLQELRRRANPAIDFIAERLCPSEGAAVPLENLVDPFNRWKRGSKITVKGLGKMLRDALGKNSVQVVHRRKMKVGEEEKTNRTVTCLIGYELDDSRLPDFYIVSAADVAAGRGELVALDAINYGKVTRETVGADRPQAPPVDIEPHNDEVPADER